TNTGNDTLNNVSVTDDHVSNLTCAGGGTNSCGTIPVGGSCTCAGSYTPPSDQCGPFTDTATTSGTGECSGVSTGPASNSATCSVARKPSLRVDKTCQNASAPGQ